MLGCLIWIFQKLSKRTCCLSESPGTLGLYLRVGFLIPSTILPLKLKVGTGGDAGLLMLFWNPLNGGGPWCIIMLLKGALLSCGLVLFEDDGPRYSIHVQRINLDKISANVLSLPFICSKIGLKPFPVIESTKLTHLRAACLLACILL